MKFFWDNISLNKDERKKLIVLLSIFLILILLKFYSVVFYSPSFIPVDPHILDSVKLASIPQKQVYTKTEYSKYPKSPNEGNHNTRYKKPKKKNISSKSDLKPINFEFNPNTLGKDSLILLGFSNYAANSLLKYRSKGGLIRTVDQMTKINGLDEETLDRLRPLIIGLPKKKYKNYSSKDTVKQRFAAKKKFKKKVPKIFEINTGDTTEFINLYGIGRVYSNRILKFRQSLGGFFSIEQIKDVWGIEDSLYQSIRPFLTVDPTLIQKRNINNMDRDSLNKHPYINWQKSKTILAYKKTHGEYNDMDDFYKLHLLEDDFVDTMKHYFIVK